MKIGHPSTTLIVRCRITLSMFHHLQQQLERTKSASVVADSCAWRMRDCLKTHTLSKKILLFLKLFLDVVKKCRRRTASFYSRRLSTYRSLELRRKSFKVITPAWYGMVKHWTGALWSFSICWIVLHFFLCSVRTRLLLDLSVVYTCITGWSNQMFNMVADQNWQLYCISTGHIHMYRSLSTMDSVKLLVT